MSYLQLKWEALEDALYAYWDNLEYLERAHWLECYEFENKDKLVYAPLDEILKVMGYLDSQCLINDMIEEIDGV